MTRPSAPTFEHYVAALGIEERRPRLTWRIPVADSGWRQRRAEIEIARATAIRVYRVEGGDSSLVAWPGDPLASREAAAVRVRVDGGTGFGPWSPPSRVEAGLDAGDWTAVPVGGSWIGHGADRDERPAQVRRRFEIDGEVAEARLYVTALGLAEVELNGSRVGAAQLSPDWTSYRSRLGYRTWDVTAALRTGENVIGGWLGDGWYRGRLGYGGGTREVYGSEQALLAQLEVRLRDGRTIVVATDGDWEARRGPILTSSLYDGECFDARLHDIEWTVPGVDGAGWERVALAEVDAGVLFAAEAPAVEVVEEIAPRSVTATSGGSWIVDFGQNLVGRVRIRVDAPAGTEITLRHAEMLEGGELSTRPLRTARATDVFITSGRPEMWEPRFTFHGFRYVELRGLPGPVDPDAIRAVVLHSAMTPTGSFTVDDPLVDRLHRNVVWSMRGNFVGIPSDCPQRDERLGWTGDIHLFAPTAAFLYDVSGVLRSWLRDLAVDQLDDGTVPFFVPVVPGVPDWPADRPIAIWGDAAVMVPWHLYESTGDAEIVREALPAARAWLRRVLALLDADGTWGSGFQLGDWLDPFAPADDPGSARADPGLVATAFLERSLRTMARMTRVLGLEEGWAELAEATREAFRGRYMRSPGRLTSQAPTSYVLALAFGLFTPDEEAEAGDALRALVAADGFRIGTGFAGTPFLLDALERGGQPGVALNLLCQTECPSWLYPVVQGATTMWERWDALRPDGTIVHEGDMTSFNHYALGAVADWLHRRIGGLTSLAPGWRRARLSPLEAGFGSCHVAHTTPYGPLEVTWTVEGAWRRIALAVPVGVTVEVSLPGLDAVVEHGAYEWLVSRTPRQVPPHSDRVHRPGIPDSPPSPADPPRRST